MKTTTKEKTYEQIQKEISLFDRIKESCQVSGMGYITKYSLMSWRKGDDEALQSLVRDKKIKIHSWGVFEDDAGNIGTLINSPAKWIIMKVWEY